MPQSPELTGGEGFTFEGNVAAFYLAALLAEDYAPGIDGRIVSQVSVQQRNFGEPLDDVIVDFEDTSKNQARLSLQVKSSLTISNSKSNKAFREIIRDSWATFNKPDFRSNVDRYGTAVGTVAASKERALRTLCDLARASLTAEDFHARFLKDGNASKIIKSMKNQIVTLLEEVKGSPCTREEEHQFIAHFILIPFDFLREGSINPPGAINCIKNCLAPDNSDKAARSVWAWLIELARSLAGQSGQIDRKRLVHRISPIAEFRGAPSLRNDLDRLKDLANNYANLISDNIAGIEFNRTYLLEKMEEKLTTARVVLVSGLPGSGKSVLVKRAVKRALEKGPVIFLKAEQLQGKSWISYATSQGLSKYVHLEELLVEIGHVGTPILFVDAVDRIKKVHQPIIIDIINTIKESPLLGNWRIVVSIRETSIEGVRIWLSDCLDALKFEILSVEHLNDDEIEALAKINPRLRTILLGSDQVEEIVRRPFFAKILHQSSIANPDTSMITPQSEVDLIESWWKRGGYDKTGQDAIERQSALRDLAIARVRQISHPIIIDEIKSAKHIYDLISDGILQYAREGVSVQFAHDIFFEWSFFYVLASRGSKWMDAIKDCGELPAVARVVELSSQWEYEKGKNWREYLARAEDSKLIRSQWLRAWLIGPLGSARFKSNEEQYADAIFAKDFRLFRKMLVWFQAEKITPNKNILDHDLPYEQCQRLAYVLGRPSDIFSWRRLINFILGRIIDIPQRFYPDILSIFDVWQNAFADLQNSTSQSLLRQCAAWLDAVDSSAIDMHDEGIAYWDKNLDLGAFKKSLIKILLVSSRAGYSFAAEYLKKISDSKQIQDDEFHDIIVYSPILAQYLPQSLVDTSLAFFLENLPDERADREKVVFSDGTYLPTSVHFTLFDWENLSIHNRHRDFLTPSPLREPFHSLFQSSPDHALQLLRDLCNHAMTAWRQMHDHSHDRGGIPIPLEITFPWGTQIFWGTDREYLWFRSTWAPKPIGCAFMALEEWCFAEIEKSRDVDELIQQVVEGNECIAILGVASMIMLHTERVSNVTLPLVTSQRLLTADHNRMVQDPSSSVNLMGFMNKADKIHIEAIQAANARNVRRMQLRQMVPMFVFGKKSFSDRVRKAILDFEKKLPFQYEEDSGNSDIRNHLVKKAIEYAELVDIKNYQMSHYDDGSDQASIIHVSPSAAQPENVARTEESAMYLRLTSLSIRASKLLQKRKLDDDCIINDAILLSKEVKEVNIEDIFDDQNSYNDTIPLEICRSAVSAAAAIILNFRGECSYENIEWAHDVLERAMRLPEKSDQMLSYGSLDSLHQGIFVARCFAADIRENTADYNATNELIRLIAYPLEDVAISAFEEACDLWSKDSKLTWAALMLAFSRCHVSSRSHDYHIQHSGISHKSSEVQLAVDTALEFYENGNGWPSLPLPPSPWVAVNSKKGWFEHQRYEEYHEDDLIDPKDLWGEPDVFWDSKKAKRIFSLIPIKEILDSSARSEFLDFLSGILDWTIQKNAPPWVKPGRRDQPSTQIMEWTDALGSRLGHVAGLVPLDYLRNHFLDPIFELERENCWALLAPFTIVYVRHYVYGASIVQDSTVDILDRCLGRFLKASIFDRDSSRSGSFLDFHQYDLIPDLIRTLMFVLDEYADSSDGYENDEWKKVSQVLPVIDRFVRAGGWIALVMDSFLMFCERAKDNYPAEDFADQVLAVIGDGPDRLRGWHGTPIPARIAGLVQHFAHRETPMQQTLAQKFLRILDVLVDMGDRRSAALQQSNAFREVQMTLSS
ncbi:ATP-binding protein [Thioalkalivibrio sp. HK1]|uniref:ATP-binding protein n=1 Tax=Thioalkalivibrio sp. HK1 TaxID=1469245 RepID=UPI0004700069|nr:ATP-binding protein [Thioalkalivibrio sp. HK1]